ncbi:MAG: hypothetical protein D6704_00045 [Nitrospirae bacterium]|nr:MAG: hypothetical protein D6704_00045 [Nitrospirota bacterium]
MKRGWPNAVLSCVQRSLDSCSRCFMENTLEKTLYLSEHPRLRIRRDGPSIWVEHAGQAGRRVPARLVRRVLIRGNVALDAGSLMLFADRGVPITLVRRDGTPSAVIVPFAVTSPRRAMRQRGILEDRRKREQFCAWLEAWERGRQIALVARLAPHVVIRWKREGFRREDYDAVLEQHLDQPVADSGERAFVAGLLFEFVLSELAAEGWDPQIGIRQLAGPLGFAHDLTEALAPEVDRVWVETVARSRAPVATSFTLIREFERARPRLTKLLRSMLRQYERLLWEP